MARRSAVWAAADGLGGLTGRVGRTGGNRPCQVRTPSMSFAGQVEQGWISNNGMIQQVCIDDLARLYAYDFMHMQMTL